MPRMTTLMMLSRHSPASISDISRHLNLSLGATSHLVDRLVDDGFVTRTEAAEDRRQKHVALTGRGERFADEVRRVRVEEMVRRLALLPAPLLSAAQAVLAEVLTELGAADNPCLPIAADDRTTDR
jgi:DNA-binding MarR family transcriptional regulator